jgi:mono/diheme cytochrome c family protein
MMRYLKSGILVLSVAFIGAMAFAEEKDITVPRVPGDQRAAAKAMKNPHPTSPENIAKGKAIFEGKGTCFNCHGTSGKGDGPAGQILNPSPRDFTNVKFNKLRTAGEMLWVIKSCSAGTGMVPLIGTAVTEDEAWLAILYERSLGGEK